MRWRMKKRDCQNFAQDGDTLAADAAMAADDAAAALSGRRRDRTSWAQLIRLEVCVLLKLNFFFCCVLRTSWPQFHVRLEV